MSEVEELRKQVRDLERRVSRLQRFTQAWWNLHHPEPNSAVLHEVNQSWNVLNDDDLGFVAQQVRIRIAEDDEIGEVNR